MTEEEFFRKNYPDSCYGDKPLSPHWDFFQDGVEFGERKSEKRIEELEKKISVLLSCKNCPENKGGFICAKEYENKCLAQKIQYIKELKEENAELRRNEFNARSCLELQQSQDKAILNYMGDQLTKAKELLEDFICYANLADCNLYIKEQAEQFLKDSEVEK